MYLTREIPLIVLPETCGVKKFLGEDYITIIIETPYFLIIYTTGVGNVKEGEFTFSP